MMSPSMKIAAAGLLATAASAMPLEPRTAANGSFSLIAIHSGAIGIHQQAINAADGQFFIGRDTESFCPDGLLPGSCPPGNSTSLTAYASDNTAYMNVVVPGGQQVFAAPSGYYGFTQAHAHNIPDGATTTGFEYEAPAEEGTVGELKGPFPFTACPTGKEGEYQVKAVIEGLSYIGCTGIVAGAVPVDGAGAWQYE